MIFHSNTENLSDVHYIAKARFKTVGKDRRVLSPAVYFKEEQRLLLRLLQDRIKPHPSIYATVGRSHVDLIWLAIKKKSKGSHLIYGDIKSAFPHTQIDQMKKILRRSGVPVCFDQLLGLHPEAIKITNSSKSFRGLAQGFPASPRLYEAYISKALWRFTKRRSINSIAVWVDDFWIFSRSRKFGNRALKAFSWQLTKLDKLSKIHGKNSKKGPHYFSPHNNWPVLGFEIGDTMSSFSIDQEPVIQHKNALHLWNSIKKLKSLSLNEHQPEILKKLEALVPTTPMPLKQNAANISQWYNLGYPTYTTQAHMGREKNQSDFSQSIQRVRYGGAGVGPSLSLPSKQQAIVRKRLQIDSEKLNRWFMSFLKNPVVRRNEYVWLRNELWAYFIGFHGGGLLTQIWRSNKQELFDEYQSRDTQTIKFVRDCYVKELRVIDAGAVFLSMTSGLNIRLEDIKAILRGYATSAMMRLETGSTSWTIPCCEYEIGRFRFPTLGFNTLNDYTDESGQRQYAASEIRDLSDASKLCSSGIATLDVFRKVISRMIDQKRDAYANGRFISRLREPIEVLFLAEYEDMINSGNYFTSRDELMRRMKACEAAIFPMGKSLWEIAEYYRLGFSDHVGLRGVT